MKCVYCGKDAAASVCNRCSAIEDSRFGESADELVKEAHYREQKRRSERLLRESVTLNLLYAERNNLPWELMEDGIDYGDEFRRPEQ